MTSLFDNRALRPLADRLRPQKLEDVVGQDHLVAENAPLGRMVRAGHLSSMILWGTPGCGKTTIARLLAGVTAFEFEQLSAIFSGVAELRKVFEKARERRVMGQGTLLFVDEIHRFSRAQQDSFLPHMEDGTIILVGATTENPSFELNAALLSRCQVLPLKRLDEAALRTLLRRSEQEIGYELPLSNEARASVIALSDGDGRYLLNMAEELFRLPPGSGLLDASDLQEAVQRRAPIYDKGQEAHYNLMSALHKSLRGSDTDAALYWFGRMLSSGEDPHYIARRLLRFAVEDIGLADPHAMTQALQAWQAFERLGSPEGELALAQAVIYLGTAPKSNANYVAYKAAVKAAKTHGSLSPPKHILNASTNLLKDLGYGRGYQYDHDAEDGFSGQNCFPQDWPGEGAEGLKRQKFYQPKDRGYERELVKRQVYWERLRTKKQNMQGKS